MKITSAQLPENTDGQTPSGKTEPLKPESIVEVGKAKVTTPKLTAKELDEAASELGLSRIGNKTVKALRDVGMAAEQHGAIKVALGRVLVSDDRLDRLMEVTLSVAEESEDDEVKLKAAAAGTGLASQISRNAELIYKMNSQNMIEQAGEQRKFQSFGPDHVIVPVQNNVNVNLTEEEK
jgi:hypothetical protein|tara:strand:+ start:5537 stop:6073 length:537 start_codon:yes stop_codon:yes gene_type:complete